MTMDDMTAASGIGLVPSNAPIELSPYQRFIALSRYARYLPDEKRRETWEETVARYCRYMHGRFPEFPVRADVRRHRQHAGDAVDARYHDGGTGARRR